MLTDDIKKRLDSLSDEDIFKAITACDGKRTCADAGCPLHSLEMNCSYVFPYLLNNKLSALIKLKSLHSDLKDRHTSLIDSLEKSSDDFWSAHNDYLKEIENELYKQIRKYLNSLDTTGLVTQTELNMIIKKVIESGYAKIT